LSLDTTLIQLCASVFDWAQYRRTKGAVKLHLLLDHDGVYFVTCMKDNAGYGVVERRPVPESGATQRDEIVFLYKWAAR
jgi:hypothetical protein